MPKNIHIKTWIALVLIALISLGVGFFLVGETEKESYSDPQLVKIEKRKEVAVEREAPPPQAPPPAPPDMERMKRQGCVADGFLSGHGGDYKDMIKVINRSECYYLHRALESWAYEPDFEKAEEIMDKVEKKDIVYGMFIAEAVNTKTKYTYEKSDRKFDFGEMCKKGKKDFWKEDVCIPSFESDEYRKYLRQITEKAMDLGIQSFLFGQIFYQDSSDYLSDPVIPEIIREMREYASFKGMEIVVGAQTNDITDERYLKNFDFIDGGVGLRSDGSIEKGACSSRWWKKPGDWCWALLWDNLFAKKANNVFLHLDWTPKVGDDMSTFARMDSDMRKKTLKNLHSYFISQDKGFMLPVLAVLPHENGGCHGAQEDYYSSSKKYGCDDEKSINDILKKAWKK